MAQELEKVLVAQLVLKTKTEMNTKCDGQAKEPPADIHYLSNWFRTKFPNILCLSP